MLFTIAEPKADIDAVALERMLAAIALGDGSAFEAFYRATERTVYTFALSLTRNAPDAQDAMMETYLAVRTGAGRYLPMGKPLAWIFTITKNAVRMQQRKLSRETPQDELPETGPPCAADETDSLALREALTILAEDEREIVLLHAVSGLRHREIADALALPLSTVLSKYSRAMRKLRRHLTALDEEVGNHAEVE
ncbi:RNA polymerase sigma factor [Butyricicoccus faecihominis]|uniref:RNA polymerase sigma factor n=1 Tax=Butyricicoccus faecihominis TaxID=1712515 RepID=UPI002478D53C|nr:RNA polymerase sigma factor [Butyricicoccus faecihominis]MCQ5129997.1 RNA polymerase sigma factor [Butyricicoccus faecihominis]